MIQTVNKMKREMEWYNGKKVFITGGSSGIGKASAERLAGWGADVCIASRRLSRLQAALEDIRGKAVRPGQKILAMPLDVTHPKKCHITARKAVEAFGGGIDVLINNAGASWPGYLERIPDKVWDGLMQVNYMGTVNCTRAFLPYFIQQRRGRIANVSSVLGFMGLFGYSAYAASKFAVVGFSESIRQDLLRYNIKISVFYPPDTDTPLLHQENKIKPEETRVLAGKIKPMPADVVAMHLLKGVARGKFIIIPGFMSKLTYALNRYAPFLLRGILDRELLNYQKKLEESGEPVDGLKTEFNFTRMG
jgi:3-dehydrosphinganine reductase